MNVNQFLVWILSENFKNHFYSNDKNKWINCALTFGLILTCAAKFSHNVQHLRRLFSINHVWSFLRSIYLEKWTLSCEVQIINDRTAVCLDTAPTVLLMHSEGKRHQGSLCVGFKQWLDSEVQDVTCQHGHLPWESLGRCKQSTPLSESCPWCSWLGLSLSRLHRTPWPATNIQAPLLTALQKEAIWSKICSKCTALKNLFSLWIYLPIIFLSNWSIAWSIKHQKMPVNTSEAFSRGQGDVIKASSGRIFILLSCKTRKSSQFSHLTSWNGQMFGLFAWEITYTIKRLSD